MKIEKDMKKAIYSKFIDESKMQSLECALDRSKYWYCTFYMAAFSLCVGTFPTFTGYSFENKNMIFAFVCEILMFLFFFYFCIKLFLLEKRHPVFKKKWYPYAFALGYLLLSLAFAIIAFFTTKFVSDSPQTFSVEYNPIYYYSIFLPLFFAYLFFCYYAFMKVFAKYAKESKHRNGDKNMY